MTRKRWIVFLVVAGCLLMAFVDFTQMHYVPKAAMKILAFVSIPVFYRVFATSPATWDFLWYKKKSLGYALLLGIFVYVCILLAYFALGSFFDFSNVAHVLNDTVGVNKGNFLYISIYISFINSFIEEFFFRGFAFLTLRSVSTRRFAMIFSSLAFAVYHVTLMAGLFDLPLYLLCLVALAIAGLMFNLLDEKSGTLYPSWIVHAGANFAINTIGFILLGMIR
jgi:membrane protease YdiL (CAAX protease family)